MLVERIIYRFDAVKDYRFGVDHILGCLRPMLLERRKHYTDLESVIFIEALVEGRTLGVFECDDVRRTANALITATQALLPYSLSPAELGSRPALEERAIFLVDLLCRSIEKSTEHKAESGQKELNENAR